MIVLTAGFAGAAVLAGCAATACAPASPGIARLSARNIKKETKPPRMGRSQRAEWRPSQLVQKRAIGLYIAG
jgi:hypothetical protein